MAGRIPCPEPAEEPETARTNALHPVRPILTGQQWNKSGHDGGGTVPSLQSWNGVPDLQG